MVGGSELSLCETRSHIPTYTFIIASELEREPWVREGAKFREVGGVDAVLGQDERVERPDLVLLALEQLLRSLAADEVAAESEHLSPHTTILLV